MEQPEDVGAGIHQRLVDVVRGQDPVRGVWQDCGWADEQPLMTSWPSHEAVWCRLTHRRSRLSPAWLDSLDLLWCRSLRSSSALLFCFRFYAEFKEHMTTDRLPFFLGGGGTTTHRISELTTRMELSVRRVKLVSMQRPFSNWAGSLAISNHLPMNCEGGEGFQRLSVIGPLKSCSNR